jgi:hypothetical protein
MNEKKEKYTTAELEVVEFEAQDVIRTSSGDELPDDEF